CPSQIRTWRFPPYGSSADRVLSRGFRPDLHSNLGLRQREHREVFMKPLPCQSAALTSALQPSKPRTLRLMQQAGEAVDVTVHAKVIEVPTQLLADRSVLLRFRLG